MIRPVINKSQGGFLMKINGTNIFWIILFAVSTAGIDFIVAPSLYPGRLPWLIAGFDSLIMLLIGFSGVILIRYTKTPFLFYNDDDPKESKKSWLLLLLLSMLLIALNAVIWYNSKEQIQSIGWVKSLTPINSILISIRAGITEEVIFRFFLFSLLLLVFAKIIHSKILIFLICSIISALAFAFLLHSGSIVSLVAGIILSYIYYKKGLLPAIIVHFLGDFIPFLMISI
ncbi:MAG: CPBP family glutamic-type intramembrane protease [Bacteroidales bacterium]